MHGQLARSWTVAQLAKMAGLSRSAFFERFQRTVAMPPMEYLLAWRMAVAKDLLRRHDLSVGEVAERVGHGSARNIHHCFQPPRGPTSAPLRARGVAARHDLTVTSDNLSF
jgi:transcriptional regulator GlxA family with amidase domain